jgi:hypothetical protein
MPFSFTPDLFFRWAAISDFAAKIKVIQGLVSDLQNSEKNGLYSLCQTVMENNTPPIEQNTVIAECCVSGKVSAIRLYLTVFALTLL